MKLRWITLLLLGVMGALLALSEQAGQAVRQGLSLCAGSMIPSLFPFFVLSSLFTSLGGGTVLWRLPFFSRQGSTVFFLGALGGYPLGAAAAAEMAEAGCGAIELCGGFGIRGTYLVEQAVAGKARVGAVRFDLHPGLDNKSGDELF